MTIPFDWSTLVPNGDFDRPDDVQDTPMGPTRLWLPDGVNLGGVMMHLEAIEVRLVDIPGDEFGGQEWQAVNPCLEDDLLNLERYSGMGSFRTHEINGRHYVIVLTPYSQ